MKFLMLFSLLTTIVFADTKSECRLAVRNFKITSDNRPISKNNELPPALIKILTDKGYDVYNPEWFPEKGLWLDWTLWPTKTGFRSNVGIKDVSPNPAKTGFIPMGPQLQNERDIYLGNGESFLKDLFKKLPTCSELALHSVINPKKPECSDCNDQPTP